jgi:hypothetical protein
VVIISHSPLFYWWPVWAVGFVMAFLTFLTGYQVAFVPTGTVAERGLQVKGHEGPRDVLIVPAGKSLPAEYGSDELLQPGLRMVTSNNPGIIWGVTFCVVLVITHVRLQGVWSVVAILVIILVVGLFAGLGLWDPILRWIHVIDVHINGLGYLSISLFLFILWLLTYLVFDRQVYMIFTPGQLRVRMAIGAGETVFDTRGIVVEKHRDDLFRHWLLGFGSGDLTVRTSGTNPRQMEMLNVLNVNHKLKLINAMVQERAVIQVPR